MENDYKELVRRINDGENFSFSRWGDGEWNAYFGKQGHNCDKHQYFSGLGNDLRVVVNKPQEYMFGLQNLGYNQRKEQIDEITKINDIVWVDADVLHKASIQGVLHRFILACNSRRIVFVGHKGLKKLNEEVLRIDTFIEIPEVDCYLVKQNIVDNLKSHIKENDLVLYCASMTTNVIIDEIYSFFKDSITQIDCGSVFEPYIGNNTRRYHNDIIEKLNK